MKKTLLATMLLTIGSTAIAQNVQIYGKMRIYTESDKVGTSSAITKQTNDGSRIGFRGTEELGNGLKTFFVIETNIAADSPTATTLGDRQSTLGIGNQIASIEFGRSKNSLAKLFDEYDPFGNAGYSSITTVHAAQGARLSNGSFVNFKLNENVSINMNHGNTESASADSIFGGGVNVKFANFSAAYANYDNGSNSVSNTFSSKYNLEKTGTTFAIVYSQDKVSGVETKGKSFGVTQKLSAPWTAFASYGKNENVDGTNIGLNYALSKRTSIRVHYKNEDHVNNSSDRTQYAVGIDHNF